MVLGRPKTALLLAGLMVLSGMSVLSGNVSSSSPDDWLGDWDFRKPVAIYNDGSPDQEVTLRLDLDTSSLMEEGKLSTDCSDLRITESDGSTEIPSWIEEGCGTTDTTIWFKLSRVPRNVSGIFVYYGNMDASSTSSQEDVFRLFDHFQGNSLDEELWTAHGDPSYSIDSSQIKMWNEWFDHTENIIYSDRQFSLSDGLTVEWRGRLSHIDEDIDLTVGLMPQKAVTGDFKRNSLQTVAESDTGSCYCKQKYIAHHDRSIGHTHGVGFGPMETTEWLRYQSVFTQGTIEFWDEKLGLGTWVHDTSWEEVRVIIGGSTESSSRYGFLDWVGVRNTLESDPNLHIGPEQTDPVSPSGTGPTAAFSTTSDGLTLEVDASSSQDPDHPDDQPHLYVWEWDDGEVTLTTDSQTSHVYENRGISPPDGRDASTYPTQPYDVTLHVFDWVHASEPETQSIEVGPSDNDLAMQFAPIFYHDTDSDDYSVDELTRFDFDQDWDGLNNWENEEESPPYLHDGAAYYTVAETRTHYLVSYYTFHPRDVDGVCDPQDHENDLEGALLIVAKHDSTFGAPLAALTFAHGWFNTYVTPTGEDSGVSVRSSLDRNPTLPCLFPRLGPEDDSLTLSEDHPLLGVEAGGHGIFNQESPWVWNARNNDFKGGDGHIYEPSLNGMDPADCDGLPEELRADSCGNDRDAQYELVRFGEVWDRRYCYTGAPEGCPEDSDEPFAWYGAFAGDNGKKNAAKAPWIIDAKEDSNLGESPAGAWFEDPAQLVQVYLGGLGDFSSSYVHRSTGGLAETYREDTDSYPSSEDRTWVWTQPGVERMKVHFTDIKLESGDTLKVTTGSGGPVALFSDGSWSDCWTDWVEDDTVRIQFQSDDDGVEGWGFYAGKLLPEDRNPGSGCSQR